MWIFQDLIDCMKKDVKIKRKKIGFEEGCIVKIKPKPSMTTKFSSTSSSGS